MERIYDGYNKTKGYLRNETIYNRHNQVIGYIHDCVIYDNCKNPVAYFCNEMICNLNDEPIGFVKDYKVYDLNGRKLGRVNSTFNGLLAAAGLLLIFDAFTPDYYRYGSGYGNFYY